MCGVCRGEVEVEQASDGLGLDGRGCDDSGDNGPDFLLKRYAGAKEALYLLGPKHWKRLTVLDTSVEGGQYRFEGGGAILDLVA